nr:MAG TPA: hypothetical protein [Caudoviricetes sp.]
MPAPDGALWAASPTGHLTLRINYLLSTNR